MRCTKVIKSGCIEVISKDGKPQRVYPSHDWWHVFLRLSQLENQVEPLEVTDIHVDEFTCPACGHEDTTLDIKQVPKFCRNCGQALYQEN